MEREESYHRELFFVSGNDETSGAADFCASSCTFYIDGFHLGRICPKYQETRDQEAAAEEAYNFSMVLCCASVAVLS